jgi:hypothetical protein
VHHQRDEGHDAHHHRGQAVDEEADFHLQVAGGHPLVDRAGEARAVHHGRQRHRRQDERDQDAEDGDAMRVGAADLLAEQAGNDRAGERRHRHDHQLGEGKIRRHVCDSFPVSP